MTKCASTGLAARPLMGKISCGHAEKAATRSISARNPMKQPRVEEGRLERQVSGRRPRNVHEEIKRTGCFGRREPEFGQSGGEVVGAVVVDIP